VQSVYTRKAARQKMTDSPLPRARLPALTDIAAYGPRPGIATRATKWIGKRSLGADRAVQIAVIQDHLQQLNGGWVNPKKTVDRVIAGDPNAQLKGIAVSWMSYMGALKRAVELGCNLFITHEPTFYSHTDDDPESLSLLAAKQKQEFIRRNHLTVLRCHDLWDQYPELGIPDAWAKMLGFGPPLSGSGYYRLLDVGDLTAGDVARQVAGKVAVLGQQAVQLIGDPDRVVQRMIIGTGAITPFRHYLGSSADIYLCTDDGFSYWRDGALAIDMGVPVIVVHHQVAEEHGMQLLAAHLEQRFRAVPVYHIAQKCMYRLCPGMAASSESLPKPH
jgi:putative NIF3 family GTP cyclohydrolase 1 type 2